MTHTSNNHLISPTLQKPLFLGPEVFGSGSTVVVNGQKMGILSSLARLKDDVGDIAEGGEETILELRPREFTIQGEKQYGFIAEEIEAVDPVLAEYLNGELTGYNSRAIIALLVRKVQELSSAVDYLLNQK